MVEFLCLDFERSVPAISSMRGRRAATRRGVKALLMIDRNLAWSGGSMAPSQRWKMAVTGAKAGGSDGLVMRAVPHRADNGPGS